MALRTACRARQFCQSSEVELTLWMAWACKHNSMEGFCIGRVRSACHSGTHLHKASQLLGSHRVSRVDSARSSRIAHVLFKTTSFISASPHTPCSKQYLHRRKIAIPLQRRIGISHPSTKQSGSATQLKRRSTGSQEFIGTCTTLVSVAVPSFGP